MADAVSDKAARTCAMLWTLTALGTMIYLAIHLLTTVVRIAAGEQIAGLTDSALWGFSVHYGLLLVPPLLATLGNGKVVAWTALALGTAMAVMNSAAGVKYGLEDRNGHLLVATALAITLPALAAIVANWRWLRSI